MPKQRLPYGETVDGSLGVVGGRDDDRRFFFVHIMKTAGTTFARQLRRQFPKESIYPCKGIDWIDDRDVDAYLNIPRLLALTTERRAAIRVYTGHFPFMVRDLIDPGLTTLAILRDPIDRTISVLKHFKRSDERLRDRTLEAIYADRPTFRFFVENHQTKVFSLVPEDEKPAINCGMTTDDVRYARARENLARVDVIGLTEAYDDFIETVRRRFGWWPAGLDPVPRANVSTEGWDVEPAFRERIAADNAYDVRLYEYAKELIASR
jgi:hypothetical protein